MLRRQCFSPQLGRRSSLCTLQLLLLLSQDCLWKLRSFGLLLLPWLCLGEFRYRYMVLSSRSNSRQIFHGSLRRTGMGKLAGNTVLLVLAVWLSRVGLDTLGCMDYSRSLLPSFRLDPSCRRNLRMS